jgi:hypothetical protein
MMNEPFHFGGGGQEVGQNLDHRFFAKHFGDWHIVVFAVI